MLNTDETRQAPPDSTIDVWPMSLLGYAEEHLPVLSALELARYGRRRDEHARRFAVAHGRMRGILGGYLGCMPEKVPVRARHGEAPQVPGLCVSLSHSEDLALLAVSRSAVGVDVEDVETNPPCELSEVSELTLSCRELELLAAACPSERPRAWLRFWTRREAVLKAKPGVLRNIAMSDLDVSQDTALGVSVKDLDLGPRFVGALASATAMPKILLRELRR
jgi:4'-phosphopantetheinyl transferase